MPVLTKGTAFPSVDEVVQYIEKNKHQIVVYRLMRDPISNTFYLRSGRKLNSVIL
jgi:hypothetical protein